VEDPVQEKDLVIILISSLPDEYNYLITALETIAEDKLTWDYVRDRLIYEADKINKTKDVGGVREVTQDALFTRRQDRKKAVDKRKDSATIVNALVTSHVTATRKRMMLRN